MANCYNCGKPISKKGKTETKEHIPAQNLFFGFGDEYKKNRIIVPACLQCNQGSSLIDEEFRNVIGAISNNKELDAVSQNAAKALITYKKQYDRLQFDKMGRIVGVVFDENQIKNYHIKIFKGLFFHQYKRPLDKLHKVVAFIVPNEFTQECISYLTSNFEWNYSGHPDIFSYILQPFKENISDHGTKEFGLLIDEQIYLSLQKYNQSHAVLVVASQYVEEH